MERPEQLTFPPGVIVVIPLRAATVSAWPPHRASRKDHQSGVNQVRRDPSRFVMSFLRSTTHAIIPESLIAKGRRQPMKWASRSFWPSRLMTRLAGMQQSFWANQSQRMRLGARSRLWMIVAERNSSSGNADENE
jgi:hypothetical protein